MTRLRQSRVQDVCETLASRMASGRYAVGLWLPSERDLAREMDVSRTVMREATRHLESEGLLEIFHGKGIRVVNKAHHPIGQSVSRMIPDRDTRLRHLMEARLILEPEIARLAARRARPAAIRTLESIHEKLEACQAAEEAVDIDLAFHQTIAEIAGNGVIRLMLEAVADLGKESRSVTLSRFGVKTAQEHHGRIIHALSIGDETGSHREMLRHVRAAQVQLETQLKSPLKRKNGKTMQRKAL